MKGRETEMIFVTGPLFSGKQDYIMRTLGWSETDFLEKAVRDVQDLAAEAAEAVEIVEAVGAVEIAEAAEAVGAAEAAGAVEIAEATGAVGASPSPLDALQEKLESLADRLSQKEVVIATETGCGVIPIDPRERRNREAAGRLSCLLAERAQTVVRVCCGIPQVLKSSEHANRCKKM